MNVSVIESIAAAESAWRLLESQNAVATPFQRFDWVAPWYRYVAANMGEKVLILLGLDRAGAPSFLWPFVYRPDAPLVIAHFPGGAHSSINMGLWTRAAAAEMTATALRAILGTAARQCGIDAFELTRQPLEWNGMENPLSRLPRRATANDVYGVTLPLGSREVVLEAVLTRDMRSRLRKKERKLEKLANYRYFRATTPDEVDRVLTAFLAQKSAHFAAQGIRDVFAEPEVTAFLREACMTGLDTGKAAIELHVLEGGGEVIAVMGGTADSHRFSGMFTSYTTGDSGRWSPGLVLITHLLSDCADRGIGSFDLGAGSAFYKNFFCREPAKLFDSVVAVSWRGRASGPVLVAAQAAKRYVNASPFAQKMLRRLRQTAA